MAINHNATEDNDQADLQALRQAWGAGFIRGRTINIEFDASNVTIEIPDLDIHRRASRTRWSSWVADGFPISEEADGIPLPPLTATARRQARAAAQANATPEPVRATVAGVEERDRAAPAVEPSEEFLSDLAHRTLEVALAEREGDQGKNAARFRRGDLMVELAAVARASNRRVKDMLADLNERTLELAENNAIIGYEPIIEQEASRTRKVVQAFGSSGEFRMVNAISRVTGEPVVLDDGEPPLLNLTDVALNKLIPLTGLANEDHNEVLSFAYRYTEKIVGKARSVAKATDTPLINIMRALDAHRVTAAHPITGEAIQVQPEGREAIDFLGAMVGEAPTPDIVSIKTSRGFYETFWEPLRQLMSAVASRYEPSLVAADSEGQVSNVLVFEHVIAQYFNVHEDTGVSATLGAMVRAETITQAQAEQFLANYAFDPESGEWRQVNDISDEDMAAAAGEWDDEAEDDIGDDDAQWDDGLDDDDADEEDDDDDEDWDT